MKPYAFTSLLFFTLLPVTIFALPYSEYLPLEEVSQSTSKIQSSAKLSKNNYYCKILVNQEGDGQQQVELFVFKNGSLVIAKKIVKNQNGESLLEFGKSPEIDKVLKQSWLSYKNLFKTTNISACSQFNNTTSLNQSSNIETKAPKTNALKQGSAAPIIPSVWAPRLPENTLPSPAQAELSQLSQTGQQVSEQLQDKTGKLQSLKDKAKSMNGFSDKVGALKGQLPQLPDGGDEATPGRLTRLKQLIKGE